MRAGKVLFTQAPQSAGEKKVLVIITLPYDTICQSERLRALLESYLLRCTIDKSMGKQRESIKISRSICLKNNNSHISKIKQDKIVAN